jgi:magnesium transporter
MSHDERIDLLKILPENIQNQVYRRIDQSDRDDIKKLMIYEEGSVGSLVTTAYASVKQDDSVKEALAHLRKTSLDKETIYYVYVVDKENRLLGLVSLRELIIAAPSTLIKNIMSSEMTIVADWVPAFPAEAHNNGMKKTSGITESKIN